MLPASYSSIWQPSWFPDNCQGTKTDFVFKKSGCRILTLLNNGSMIHITWEYHWDNVPLHTIPKRRVCAGPQENTLVLLLLCYGSSFNHYLWLAFSKCVYFYFIHEYLPAYISMCRMHTASMEPEEGVGVHQAWSHWQVWTTMLKLVHALESASTLHHSHVSSPYHYFLLCLIYTLLHGNIWL